MQQRPGNLILTSRQREVLEALRAGHSNKVIARELHISEATVKTHVRQLMKKFCAQNRTQVVVRASARQAVQPGLLEQFGW